MRILELLCPSCGSDQVIPLNLPQDGVHGEILREMPERPLAKCIECGHRLTAAEVAAQEERSST